MTLQVSGASIVRGGVRTLNQVSLSVARGERVALVGHNGAGKTTLMKAVLGLWPLDEGEVSILGEPPGSRAAQERTAYLPENVSFHPALTGREVLQMLASIRKDSASVERLLERVGIADAASRRIGTYSKGMRQRLGLAQALLAQPRLAVLDEPTSGLDPVSRNDFYKLVDELAGNGTAILISSHALTELEAKTDRIAILRNGHLVVNDTLTALRQQAGLPIKVRITANSMLTDAIAESLGGRRINGQSLELVCAPETKVKTLSRITELGSIIEDVDVIPPCLDELYQYYSAEDQQ